MHIHVAGNWIAEATLYNGFFSSISNVKRVKAVYSITLIMLF